MKAEQLRIGNYIKIDNVVCRVDKRAIFDFNNDERKKDSVPITSGGF